MPQEKEGIVNYIKRAFELKDQECYKQSIEMLYKALAEEPDNTEILFQIGELYYLLYNYPRAMQYMEKVLEEEPNHQEALNLLKNIYIKQNETAAAKDIAERLYTIESSQDNLKELIKLYGQLGLFEEMEKHLDEIEKSDKCLFEYANAYYKNRNNTKSAEIIEKALAVNPENIDCEILKGKILFDKNELAKAKEIFTKYSKNTDNAEVLNYLGLFAMEDLNFIEAIKYFSKASHLMPKNPLYLNNLGNAYYLNGWQEEAVSAYKKAVYLSPDNLDYRYSLAYIYFENKEYEKSEKEIDFILENNGKYYNAKVIRALLLLKQKNFLEAEKILKSNIDEGCDNNFTLSSLAKIETELGKYELGEQHIEKVLERDGESLKYQCDLGYIYIKEKEYEKAVKTAEEVISKNENFIYGYILGANAAYLNKDYEKSKSFASRLLTIDINIPEGYYYLALVRLEEHDYEEAIECMKRAITLDITNAQYYAKMAEIYKLSGDTQTAFEYIKEAESIDHSEEYKILYRQFASLNRK